MIFGIIVVLIVGFGIDIIIVFGKVISSLDLNLWFFSADGIVRLNLLVFVLDLGFIIEIYHHFGNLYYKYDHFISVIIII